MDVFYEETAFCLNAKSEKRKYTILKILSVLFAVLAFLWLFLIFFGLEINSITEGNVLLNVVFWLFPIIMNVFLSIGFGLLKNRHCLDYDYTFITGSIRISKVINTIKRKNLYNFETSSIEKIGKFDSDTYLGYANNKEIKKVVVTPNDTPSEGKDFYYFAVNGLAEQKVLLILECSKTFIANVMKFTNRYVLEKDFK